MCGIVGSLHWQSPDNVQLIQRMAQMIAHRGPDAEKVIALGPLVLGHRRLSIIDVSPLSNQPMSDHTQRYWVVYNGELYNYKALKSELNALGHSFQTDSDTEVVLEAWKQFGIACLQKFVGMFAFALWDKEEQTFFMARDRMGEKPLYYTLQAVNTHGGWDTENHDWRNSFSNQGYNIVFASEMKALCLHPSVSFRINPEAMSQFLSLNYVLTDSCMISGIEKLPPAHYLLLKKNRKPEIKCYWDLSQAFVHKKNWRSKVQASETLQDLLQTAVQGQMISDVPLGAFLSGGVDSSTIVSNMTRAKKAKEINTFSIGFHEASYNELAESQTVARHLHVDHHTQFVDADRINKLPTIIQTTDEPFADSSMIPTYFLAEFARQKVKVCLSGDGGDELFIGYETHTAGKLHRIMRYMPRGVIRCLGFGVEKYWPVSHGKVSLDYKLKQFLKGCLLNFQEAHYFWRVIFSEPEKANLLKEDLRQKVLDHNPYTHFAKHFNPVANCHPLDQASYVDMKTWMVDDILVKVDRFSMAHSLEVRAPFLDHRLVEFAASLPVDWKMKFFQKKHLLKLSQQNNLPKAILHRAKKGFNAPISPWLNGKLSNTAREITLDNAFLQQWFKRDTLEELWQEHRSFTRDHGLKLFGLMCLGLWFENYHNIFSNKDIHQPVLERGKL